MDVAYNWVMIIAFDLSLLSGVPDKPRVYIAMIMIT